MTVEFDAPGGYVELTRSVGIQPTIVDSQLLEQPLVVHAPLAVDKLAERDSSQTQDTDGIRAARIWCVACFAYNKSSIMLYNESN